MLEVLTRESSATPTFDTAKVRTAVGCVLVVAALASLAFGQAVIGGNFDSRLPLTDAGAHLRMVFGHPETILFGTILLVLGGVMLAIAVRPRASRDAASTAELIERENLRLVLRWPVLVLAITAALLDAELIYSLATGHYHDWFVLVFGAVIALLVWACFLVDRKGGIRKLPSVTLWEAAFLVGLGAIFVAINLKDLTSWYYSAQGDEYSFLGLAKAIAAGKPVNLFSQTGVYNSSPIMSSVYQSLFMRLPGSDIFDWKLSLVVAVVLCLPPFYLFVRELVNRRTAVIATAMLASSHYFFAFVHTGYDSILPVPITIAAFALFYLALRYSNAVLALLAGLAAAGGFYTFYSSRAAIVVMAIYFLTLPSWWHRWRVSLPTGAGFIVGVLPIFAVNKWGVIDMMLRESAVSYNASIVGSRTDRIFENLERTLVSFNYNVATQHYVSGSLVDPITAALFIGGLIYALLHIRQQNCRFLVIWYAMALLAVGVLSPYTLPAVSRLHYIVPVAVIFAALALDAAITQLSIFFDEGRNTAISAAVLTPLLALILVVNVHRFWVEAPKHQQLSGEAVALRVAFSKDCRQRPGDTYIFAQGFDSLLGPAVDSYDLGDRAPKMGKYSAIDTLPAEDDAIACTVVIGTDEERTEFSQILKKRLPNKTLSIEMDEAKHTRVAVLR